VHCGGDSVTEAGSMGALAGDSDSAEIPFRRSGTTGQVPGKLRAKVVQAPLLEVLKEGVSSSGNQKATW
jgi:hypothetical protein